MKPLSPHTKSLNVYMISMVYTWSNSEFTHMNPRRPFLYNRLHESPTVYLIHRLLFLILHHKPLCKTLFPVPDFLLPIFRQLFHYCRTIRNRGKRNIFIHSTDPNFDWLRITIWSRLSLDVSLSRLRWRNNPIPLFPFLERKSTPCSCLCYRHAIYRFLYRFLGKKS